uniref:Uncharacterized protein n=1 Tax=Prymnesium polylepis TaxID=72548 RepID=A0A7S4JBB5_9EUKA
MKAIATLLLTVLAGANALTMVSPAVRHTSVPLARAAPLCMKEVEGTGFGTARDPKTGEYKPLTEFTPQITLFMSVVWIAEYCTHHGIPWGTGLWK